MPNRPERELFRRVLDGNGWVLCETRLRAARVRELFSADESSTAIFRAGIYTTGDAIRLLIRRATLFSDSGEDGLLSELRDQSSETLRDTIITQLLRAGGHDQIFGSGQIPKICRFLDRARLGSLTEALFAAALDESGDIAPGSEELAHLLVLLDQYRTEQERRSSYDRIGLIERALAVLSPLPRGHRAFPPMIVLDQLTEVSALERELWELIGRSTELTLAVPEVIAPILAGWCGRQGAELSARYVPTLAGELPPSRRHWAGIASWVAALEQSGAAETFTLGDHRPAIAPVPAWLFDAVPLPELQEGAFRGIEIWECANCRTEVEAVLDVLTGDAESGGAAGEWHIVVPNLAAYAPLIRLECDAREIPCAIPKGERSLETPGGGLLAGILQTVVETDVASVRALLQHPWFGARRFAAHRLGEAWCRPRPHDKEESRSTADPHPPNPDNDARTENPGAKTGTIDSIIELIRPLISAPATIVALEDLIASRPADHRNSDCDRVRLRREPSRSPHSSDEDRLQLSFDYAHAPLPTAAIDDSNESHDSHSVREGSTAEPLDAESCRNTADGAIEVLGLIESLGLVTSLREVDRWLPFIIRVIKEEKPDVRARRGLGLMLLLDLVGQIMATRATLGEETAHAFAAAMLRSIRLWRPRFREQALSLNISTGKVSGPNISGLNAAVRSRTLGRTVRSFRRLRVLLRQASESLDLWAPEAGIEPGSELERQHRAERFARAVTKLLAMTWIGEPYESGAVVVTEPLDVRGQRGLNTAILGLSSAAFPFGDPSGAELRDPLEELTLRLSGSGDPKRKIEESFSLIDHVFRTSERIILSVPRDGVPGSGGGSHGGAAEFLRLLSTRIPPRKIGARITGHDQAGDVASKGDLAGELGAETVAGVALATARARHEFTEYDGAIGAGGGTECGELHLIGADPVRSARASLPPNTGWYSVSTIETLAECAHRFFFLRVLGLEGEENERHPVAREAGTLVHTVLERFFGAPERVKAISAGWANACSEMIEIANGVIEESPWPWRTSPLWRAEIGRILSGLSREMVVKHGAATPSAVPGMLLSAMAIHREILRGSVVERELRFGSHRVPPLVLQGSGRPIAISGTIDRVDLMADGAGLAIWDYKTGGDTASKARRQLANGVSFQIPLYARALREVFDETRPVLRGGLILLGSWRESAEARDEVSNNGAVAELLALRRSGNRFVFDSGEVAAWEDRTVERVIALDDRVLSGRFSQSSHTSRETCGWCEFRNICGRDVALLAAKTKGSPPWSGSIAVPPPPPERSILAFELRPSHGLSKEQELATAPDISIALTAGAGSGKTTVLASRYIELLVSGEPWESIVAITFTEKAAGELRERIALRIEQLLLGDLFHQRGLEPIERERLLNARTYLPLAPIGTIHSFALRLISINPDGAGIGAFDRVIAGSEHRECLEAAIESALRAEELREPLARILALGHRLSTVRSELTKLIHRREFVRNILSEESPLTDQRCAARLVELLTVQTATRVRELLVRAEKRLAEWTTECDPLFTPDKKKRTPEEIDALRRLRDGVESFRECAAAGFERAGSRIGAALRTIEEMLEQEPHLRGRREIAKHARQALAPFRHVSSGKIDFDRPLREVAWLSAPTGELEQRGVELAVDGMKLIAGVEQRYRAEKLRLRVVDFDDLIEGARTLACERHFDGEHGGNSDNRAPSWVRARVRELFRHIMVDEFQDTDAAQWEIVRTLVLDPCDSEPAGAASHRSAMSDSEPLRSRSLFVVGDVQQAIYGFRGGDPAMWARAVDRISESGGERRSLRENYRSDPHLVRFFNALFPGLFADDRAYLVDGYQPLEAKRSALHNSPERVMFVCDDERPLLKRAHGGAESDGAPRNESVRIAWTISEILTDLSRPEGPVRWPALRGASPPIIAVLTRSAGHGRRIKEALGEHGIRAELRGASTFFDSPEVHLLEHLLGAFLPHPDPIAIVGALRSRLCGFSDRELFVLGRKLGNRWSDLMGADGLEVELFGAHAAHWSRRFSSWRIHAAAETPSFLLERILRESALEAVYEAVGDHESFENFSRCIAILREHEASQYGHLGLLAARDWLRDQRESGDGAPGEAGSAAPVVIMTVHAAKGLEFPLVVLPFLGFEPPDDRDFRSGCISGETGRGIPFLSMAMIGEEGDRGVRTVGDELLADEERNRSAAEERRLFYVACTRAREYLVLSGEMVKASYDAMVAHSSSVAALHGVRNPMRWLGSLLVLDHPETPEAFILRRDGEELRIPWIRVPALESGEDEVET